jgi:hypothetical protein
LHVGVSEVCGGGTRDQDKIHGDTHSSAGVRLSTWTGGNLVGRADLGRRVSRDSLQFSDLEALEDFSCFVRVADIFESFGCVLAGNVKEDFLTTTR